MGWPQHPGSRSQVTSPGLEMAEGCRCRGRGRSQGHQHLVPLQTASADHPHGRSQQVLPASPSLYGRDNPARGRTENQRQGWDESPWLSTPGQGFLCSLPPTQAWDRGGGLDRAQPAAQAQSCCTPAPGSPSAPSDLLITLLDPNQASLGEAAEQGCQLLGTPWSCPDPLLRRDLPGQPGVWLSPGRANQPGRCRAQGCPGFPELEARGWLSLGQRGMMGRLGEGSFSVPGKSPHLSVLVRCRRQQLRLGLVLEQPMLRPRPSLLPQKHRRHRAGKGPGRLRPTRVGEPASSLP